jgi:hypothetical protein
MTQSKKARLKAAAFKVMMDELKWVATHGIDEAGYIKRYGVPGQPNCYGDGGALIYAADMAALNRAKQVYWNLQ